MLLKDELLKQVDENAAIDAIARLLPRSEFSVNKTHQSDSEIVDIGLASQYLAITTDSICEEIVTGLYADPHLIGWMSVVANLSDLAAVGAVPVGLLLSMTVSPQWDSVFIRQITEGIAEACKTHNCGSLGGDLNGGSPSIGATAVGLVGKNSCMKRTGIGNNDHIYMTGPAGLGSVYALHHFFQQSGSHGINYKPVARLPEAVIIAKYASACMDTSDGIMATLDQLYRLNSISLCLEDITPMVHPVVAETADTLGITPLCFLCAIHGDFELCFTIPEERNESFLEEARSKGFHPINIGHAEKKSSYADGIYIKGHRLQSEKIRNLWSRSESISAYFIQLNDAVCEFITGILKKEEQCEKTEPLSCKIS